MALARSLAALALIAAAAAPASADSVRVAPYRPGLLVPRIGVMETANLGERHGVSGFEGTLAIDPWRDRSLRVVFEPRVMVSPLGDFSSHDRVGLGLGWYWADNDPQSVFPWFPKWLQVGATFGVVADWWDIWYDDDIPQGAGFGAAVQVRPSARLGRFEMSIVMEAGRIGPIHDWYWSRSIHIGVLLF